MSNEFHYDSETYSSIEINYPIIHPNFTIYDPKYEKWSSNITIINQMLKLNNEIELIDSKIATKAKANNSGFFDTIGHYASNAVTTILDFFTSRYLLYFCIYVLPPLVVYVIIYLICHRIKTFSFQA